MWCSKGKLSTTYNYHLNKQVSVYRSINLDVPVAELPNKKGVNSRHDSLINSLRILLFKKLSSKTSVI